MVFQSYALWPHLTALDTVAYPLRRNGAKRRTAREEALDILGRLRIAHLADRRPAELSGGEQQRVGLARALARQASLYLFDEPTAHLDTHVRGVFLDELVVRREASGAGGLYATHDAEEALGLADRVALLNAGRLVQLGTPQQVYAEPVDVWAARLTGPTSVLEGDRGGRTRRPLLGEPSPERWSLSKGPTRHRCATRCRCWCARAGRNSAASLKGAFGPCDSAARIATTSSRPWQGTCWFVSPVLHATPPAPT
ncbi:MAG: ABC transporter ATP-binding protein [Nocardioidaceae bacterium]